MKKIAFLLFLIITLAGCSSASHYSNKKLNKDYFLGKTIVFILHPNSVDKIKKEGPNVGNLRQLDVKNIFKKSVEELAYETKLNLKYEEYNYQVAQNEQLVSAEITSIRWIFTASSATMQTDVKYHLNEVDKIIEIKGKFKNMMGGDEKPHLRKSFKNANYLLLEELGK